MRPQSTIGFVNRNPLNIRTSGAQWQGLTGANKGFATFQSPEYGYRAAFKNMKFLSDRGAKTVRQMIYKWAPPQDNNHTENYIARVAAAGIDPNAPIPFEDPQKMALLARAMTGVELGGNPYKEGVALTGYQMAFNGAAPPVPTGSADTPQNRSMWSQGLRDAQPLPGETDSTLPTTRFGSATKPAPLTEPSKDAMNPQQMKPGIAAALALAGSGQTKMSDMNKAMIADALRGRVNHPVDALGRIAQVAAANYNQSRQDDRQKAALAEATKSGDLTALIGMKGPLGDYARATLLMGQKNQYAAQQSAAKRAADFEDRKRFETDPEINAAKINRAKAGRPQITIDNKAESALVGHDVKRLGKWTEDADKATATVSQLTRLQPLLKGLTTGAFAQQGLTLGQIGKRLGIEIPGGMDPNKVASAEVANALIQQMIVPMVKQLGANPTDADARRIESAMPSLSTSPEGNQLLIKMTMETARDKIGRAARARKWFDSHGKSLSGFNESEIQRAEALAQRHEKRIEAFSGKSNGWKIERVE